ALAEKLDRHKQEVENQEKKNQKNEKLDNNHGETMQRRLSSRPRRRLRRNHPVVFRRRTIIRVPTAKDPVRTINSYRTTCLGSRLVNKVYAIVHRQRKVSPSAWAEPSRSFVPPVLYRPRFGQPGLGTISLTPFSALRFWASLNHGGRVSQHACYLFLVIFDDQGAFGGLAKKLFLRDVILRT
ncbi:hypothetical protein THAOC_14876, partial [Thalassiosira oceanica]